MQSREYTKLLIEMLTNSDFTLIRETFANSSIRVNGIDGGQLILKKDLISSALSNTLVGKQAFTSYITGINGQQARGRKCRIEP